MLPYKTSEQKIDGLLISFGDIDEVKRSQEALRKERNFITTVLDAASTLMVVVLDREKRIVHFNRACQELTGYTLEEVKGRPRDLLMQPEEIAQMNASFEELLHAKQRRDQCYWVAKDGRRRLIAWSNAVTFDDRGLVEYVIRTGIDVTERQEAKEQAQESEATMRALLETAAQAVVAVRRDGRIVLVNAAAETMFGYQREELIGLKVGDLVPQRSREQHAGYQAEYFRQPQNRPMGVAQDLAGVRKNGTEFPIEVSLGHVETRDGTLAVAFVFDITERKRSRDALEQSEARLRSLTAGLLAAQEEERKRLSRDLHDDLNQRMAMLAVGVAELEAGLPDSAGAIREHLLNLETSLKGVSNDLRRTAYQLHPSVLEHLGLAAALEAYCEDVSKLGKIKARFKQHNVPEHIPEAAALCLYRVAQESLGNAVKHSGATRASVNLTGRENELILTISDTGRGFDPSEARKKGGLGLVSMEERVRLAEGILAIRTRPGDGTHVTIRIPLKTGAPC
jgi:PAS domain S-box-containing protein